MKNHILIAIGVYLLIAGLAFSQQWTQQARVTVGFEFVVGDTVLPAGTYSISTATEANNLLMFVNSETGASAMASNIDIYNKPHTFNENSNLVFVMDQSGRHVLHQVWITGDSHGHNLLHEKELPEPAH